MGVFPKHPFRAPGIIMLQKDYVNLGVFPQSLTAQRVCPYFNNSQPGINKTVDNVDNFVHNLIFQRFSIF